MTKRLGLSSILFFALVASGACAVDGATSDDDNGRTGAGGKADNGGYDDNGDGVDAGDDSDAEPGEHALCADRTGGALVTITVADDDDELFTAWIEDEVFIDEASRLLADGERRVPTFAMADGTDCDGRWSWHVDAHDAAFADFTIEVCDSLPSYIESNKDEWLRANLRWCPWGARVVSVDDRR